MLHPTLPHMPGETPASFASRLARLNGIPSAQGFCSDFGIDFQGLLDGKPTAVSRLADLVGMDTDQLAADAWIRDGEVHRRRGQVLTGTGIRREGRRVCVACLVDDSRLSGRTPGEACWYRGEWRMAHLRACPVHGEALTDLPIAADEPRESDFARRIDQHLERAVAGPRASLDPSPLEAYLLARLWARPTTVSWLDAMPFYAAAKATELLGVCDLHGCRRNLDGLSEDDLHRAGGRGFEIVSGGPPAIDAALTRLRVGNEPSDRRGNSPLSCFGRLYQWLAYFNRDPAFDPLRDAIAANLIEHVPLSPGDDLFGKPVTVRRVHSIRTAVLDTGLHRNRLRKALAAAGHIAADHAQRSDHEIVFDAASTREFLRRLCASLTFPELLDHLAATRSQARLLVDRGFIAPVIEDEDERVGRLRFSRDDVDAFLRRLSVNAQAVDEAPHGAFQIAEAARRASCMMTEIVELLLAGRLAWSGRLAGAVGLDAVLVDVGEVRCLLADAPLPVGHMMQAAAKLMRLRPHALKALVRLGLVASEAGRSPRSRYPGQIVTDAEIARFGATYVTLFEACGEFGLHHLAMRCRLSEAGLSPVCDPRKVGVTLYLRAEVEAQKEKSIV